MIPLVPVAVTAGLGALGYLLFKPDAPAASGGSTPAASSTPTPQMPNPLTNSPPGDGPPKPLPWVQRPADLPPPVAPVAAGPFTPPMPAPAPMPLPSLPSLPPVMPPIPMPTPIQPTDKTGVVIAPSGINLRDAPSTSGTRLSGLVAGTRVKILRYDPSATEGAPKGWYQISAPNGMTGYGSAEYILPDNGSNPVPVPVPIPVPNQPPILPNIPNMPSFPNIIPANFIPNVLPPDPSTNVTTGKILGSPGANMRNAPAVTGALVKGLYNGTIVTVLSTTLAPPTPGAPQGWVNVKDASGMTGWVSRQYVEPVSGASFGGINANYTPEALRKRTRIRA